MDSPLQYTPTILFSLGSFAFVSSITPGPNNLMLLYSGARFGFKSTIPHWMGVNIGFCMMLALCCLGVATLVLRLPSTQTVLKILGCSYMLWFAYKLWRNGALPSSVILHKNNKNTAKPLTLKQALIFQYINPKAWVMGLTVPAVYLPPAGSILANTIVSVVVFGVINLCCMSIWVQGGVMLQKLMHQLILAKFINTVIVLMTVYCAIAVWLPS